jgi:hypothetical protein
VEIEKAKEIVKLLANGTDSTTGEVFADDSYYNHPMVIRALFTVLNHVRIQKNKTNYQLKGNKHKTLLAENPEILASPGQKNSNKK